jgi:uncharacterized protein (TIGR03435 family)
MADFVGLLALVLDRPVVDKTQFTREFDLDLNLAPSGALLGMPQSLLARGNRPPEDGPDILAALQQQLGLQLERAQGPVEVLVVDRAERPIAN